MDARVYTGYQGLHWQPAAAHAAARAAARRLNCRAAPASAAARRRPGARRTEHAHTLPPLQRSCAGAVRSDGAVDPVPPGQEAGGAAARHQPQGPPPAPRRLAPSPAPCWECGILAPAAAPVPALGARLPAPAPACRSAPAAAQRRGAHRYSPAAHAHRHLFKPPIHARPPSPHTAVIAPRRSTRMTTTSPRWRWRCASLRRSAALWSRRSSSRWAKRDRNRERVCVCVQDVCLCVQDVCVRSAALWSPRRLCGA